MTEKELRFTCWNCTQETTVIVQVAKPRPTQSKDVSIVRYCEHCNRDNKLMLPDNLDVHRFILGRDRGFLGHTSDGIPRTQGEKEL